MTDQPADVDATTPSDARAVVDESGERCAAPGQTRRSADRSQQVLTAAALLLIAASAVMLAIAIVNQ
ncbi:MAG: hypothetical protein KA129_11455 [Microthrixaceae bacterium]|nr:hypothetical protein [Microthrixaceae bacterium]